MFPTWFDARRMPAALEEQLFAEHEATLAAWLPLLAPAFGVAVLLFSFWDHLLDPAGAARAAAWRAGLAALGVFAYRTSRLPWTASQRCGYIYWLYTGAMILAAHSLRDGLSYGLAGITAGIFPLALVALRLRDFLLMALPPFVLFTALALNSVPPLEFMNGVLLYALAIGMALLLMLFIGQFRRNAYAAEQELIRRSRYDALTGVLNRGCLTQTMEREFALARRHGRPLALAMVDIDRFKLVNDTHGHAAGDEVIKALACICRDHARSIDHVGRLGGEEFVCILPETAAHDAVTFAERLRLHVEAQQVQTSSACIRFTVSIGVAALRPEHESWQVLLQEADDAMYRAKREGRNRVALAQTDETERAALVLAEDASAAATG